MTIETKMKHCHTCGTTQPVEAFSKCRSKRDGLCTQCKGCVKAYYKANVEQIAEKKKAYYKEQIAEQQKGYAKAKRAAMTQAERAAMDSVKLARKRSELSSDVLYGGLTYKEACGMTVTFTELRLQLEQETGEVHHIDHIVPIKGGGTHTVCNLQVLTAFDNKAKIAEDKLLVAEHRELTDA